jgi:arginine:ornithine antiporter/lysine permease
MSANSIEKLGLPALTALVVGSMIGAGIFLLPGTFAAATGPFGALIAWCIAGIGIYLLAHVFRVLAVRKPYLDAGVYAYPRAAFGGYLGFLAAFGYWIGTCIGNVAYWVLFKSTLGALFPAFGDGNTIAAIAVASLGIWFFHFLILLGGIRLAAVVNIVLTIAKIIAIIAFLVILLAAFKLDMFRANFWGGADMPSTSLFQQVRAAMLATVFVFLGIEAASVLSRYAQRRTDIGAATLLGFFGVLALMVLASILPYGALERAEIAGMPQPSLTSILSAAVGWWGAVIVSVGLLISLLGAYLAWTLMSTEVLFVTAESGDAPKFLAAENSNSVPAAALWLTNILVQLFVISTYWTTDAFSLMAYLTSAMALVPYFLVACYGFLVAKRRDTYDVRPQERTRDLIIGALAALYTAFLIFAGGLKFLALSAILYALGTLLYAGARLEQGKRLFTRGEWVLFLVIAIGCIAAIYGLASGHITI